VDDAEDWLSLAEETAAAASFGGSTYRRKQLFLVSKWQTKAASIKLYDWGTDIGTAPLYRIPGRGSYIFRLHEKLTFFYHRRFPIFARRVDFMLYFSQFLYTPYFPFFPFYFL
jgi:hypothetical protein